MSTTRFDRAADDGFIQKIDPEAARWQFNLSLSLVAVLAIGTLTAAMTLRIEPVSMSAAPARLVVQAPQIMHVQQAAQDFQRPSGS
jgi:hypothetical protein